MRCTERGSGGDPVTEPTWALTRSQLIDALGVIGVKPLHVPGRNGGLVLAEDMADAILEQIPQAASTSTEYAVAWGGEDPNECAGIEQYDDEAGAEEMTQWITTGYVTRRTVTCSRWERVPAGVLHGPEQADGGPRHGSAYRDRLERTEAVSVDLSATEEHEL
jgi:hypothetical protein